MSVDLVTLAQLSLTTGTSTELTTSITKCTSVIIQAVDGNTGNVDITGDSGILWSASRGISIGAGKALTLTYDEMGRAVEQGAIDLNQLYATPQSNGNVLKISYFKFRSG